MYSSDAIFRSIDESKAEMIELQKILTAVPALGPESGGQGEEEKAAVLKSWLEKKGFTDLEVVSIPDKRVKSGRRPNIIATIPGEDSVKRIWIMTHLDIVPPGEISLWDSDPYTVVEKDGRIFGRGVEDNQQGMVASIFAVLAFLRNGVKPKSTIKLLFASDEENGSEYGIQYLLKEHNLFNSGDWFLVPDGGRKDGSMLEVAEKNILWVKFHLQGKQCHASMPQLGINAFTASSSLVMKIAGMNKKYSQEDPIFDPPYSTFTPTKKESNVPNINTIPGNDVFYADMRFLPTIAPDTILNEIKSLCSEIEAEYGVKIEYSIVQRTESRPTSKDAPLVKAMEKLVHEVYGVDGKPVGIGGGTVGAYLRNAGHDTVVWAKLDESAHMPNEYCIVDNMVGDAKVMARLIGEY